jgi:hypothetical protein
VLWVFTPSKIAAFLDSRSRLARSLDAVPDGV